MPNFAKLLNNAFNLVILYSLARVQGKKIKTQKELKYLAGKYYGHVIAMISVYMRTQSSLVFITFTHFSSKNTSSIKL